jgi:hypothetical protein
MAGARERRARDPYFAGREPLALQHEVYCLAVEESRPVPWVEIMAADAWTQAQLLDRFGVHVHRTQVRRNRLYLERLGYVRHLERPKKNGLAIQGQRYRAERRTPPTFLEVCKAPKEDH